MNAGGATLVVDARPTPFHLDTAHTAVIVVDMQNDFGHPQGMFGRAGIDLSGIRATIEPTRQVLDAARTAGILVVFLQMAFKPDLSDAGAPSSPNWLKHLPMRAGEATTSPAGEPSRALIRGTWNTAVIDELPIASGDLCVYKHRFSGFFQTDLHELLQARGITQLIVTGCTTSVCVESTVKDAMFLDYHCLILEDCVNEAIGADESRSNHEATMLVLQVLVGWVSDSATLLAALKRTPPIGEN
jgi:ureidoacrylate peracid hydrolase